MYSTNNDEKNQCVQSSKQTAVMTSKTLGRREEIASFCWLRGCWFLMAWWHLPSDSRLLCSSFLSNRPFQMTLFMSCLVQSSHANDMPARLGSLLDLHPCCCSLPLECSTLHSLSSFITPSCTYAALTSHLSESQYLTISSVSIVQYSHSIGSYGSLI